MGPYSEAPDKNSTADDEASPRRRSRPTSSRARSGRRSDVTAKAMSSAAPPTSGSQTSVRPKPPSLLTLDRPNKMPTNAGVSSPRPRRSSRARPVGPSVGRNRQASTSPTTQNGTLTQNSQRQSSWLKMMPPITGPRIGPRAAGRLTTAISLPSERPPAAWTARVAISGIISPPPMPCTTRNAIRLGALHARLAAIEPTAKITSAIIHSRLPPIRACAQPTRGMVAPSAKR